MYCWRIIDPLAPHAVQDTSEQSVQALQCADLHAAINGSTSQPVEHEHVAAPC